MGKIVKVLIIDDSAYIRKTVREMLNQSPNIEVVGTARNGREALEMVKELDPDVVTLDLIMPELDGVGFLKEQMLRKPLPAVIVSIASESGETALEALDAGAVDIVQKPTALATEKIYAISKDLINKVLQASLASLKPLQKTINAAPIQLPEKTTSTHNFDLLAIGISTGGPQALRYLLPQFGEDFPIPITVVIHMPQGYTEMYAKRLNELCALTVVEVQDGEEIKKGYIYIAAAGKHMTLKKNLAGKVTASLDIRPFDLPYRPSVDVLFESAANVYKNRLLGVVMTGMGDDGKQGSAWVKSQGGQIFTEAEETCIIYGMPRSVFLAGLSDQQIPLDEMATKILEAV